jgi:GNAT superfamily N-acetyltransferase
MIETRRLGPDDWQAFRQVRLASLADAPYAFGSTLAREQDFDEATWRHRLAPGNGVAVLAYADLDPVGVMGIYEPRPGRALLVAAWVDPAARGRGVGDALVAEVLAWARERGYAEVGLRVADGNEPARKLFLRNGFTPTGEREPLDSDPSVGTERLVRTL